MKLVVLSVLSIGLALAQDGPPRPGGPQGQRAPRQTMLMMAIDADHDGMISAEEIAGASKAILTLDKDGDGTITPEELRPQRPGGGPGGPGGGQGGPGGDAPRREGQNREGQSRESQNRENQARYAAPGPADELIATLMAFDKNGDGKLTKDEVPERMQGIFARGDKNNDGVLTKEEIKAMAETQARQANNRANAPPDALFRALDTDHDGMLSSAEIKNAAAALKSLDKNGDGRITEDELRPPQRRE